MTHPKKLIEVALPLEAINEGSKPETENPFLQGHPRAIHNWWARTPLSVCRAILFAQLVDDPSSHPEKFPTDAEQIAERERLFDIIRRLAEWDAIKDRPFLAEVQAELVRQVGKDALPPAYDPFAGRGSIPLEAYRLGLETYASDLNPVPVLINRALLHYPRRVVDQPPVNPSARERIGGDEAWQGLAGLFADLRHYGQWMVNEARRRIGHLYPEILDPSSDVRLPVTAWLWTRTVRCQNPACLAQMPLISTFQLSKKTGRQAWIEPIIDRTTRPPRIGFRVRTGNGKPQEPPKIGRGAKFRCLACGNVAADQHIKDEGQARRIGLQLIAVVAEGDRQRIYIPPNQEHESIAISAQPAWCPTGQLPNDPRNIWCVIYGFDDFADLFTNRQLTTLTTYADLVAEVQVHVRRNAINAGMDEAQAAIYADAIAVYLACAISRLTDYANSLTSWNPTNENVRNLFQRQAIPMVWDFAEANLLEGKLDLLTGIEWIINALTNVPANPAVATKVYQRDARVARTDSAIAPVISTDPPYYDNIGYADLADFFYVWLRRCLREIMPDIFSTVLTPKNAELIASPYRQANTGVSAEDFFQEGFIQVFQNLSQIANRSYPMTVYYAFKQEEAESDGRASTGWETMLEGLIQAGLEITGTWPVRTTKKARAVARDTNALASAVVIVCRVRPEGAAMATRRDFLAALQAELPAALRDLQRGNIAPVDLAQAAIGPGMAIYSRYRRVIEADGSPLRVRAALALINQALDEYLSEQEGEFDPDTRWALAWFEQFAFDEAEYGIAETLSKAKNTSVSGMVEAGILHARAGKVRLLRREELAGDWDPSTDRRPTVWEATQHLIRTMQGKGEVAAADLLARMGALGGPARDLAYRLYTLCERKGWAQEALPYNALVVAWSDVGRLAGERRDAGPVQGRLV